MTTITAFNKARNTTYVYESDSHWDKDKDKQQSRSKRRLIGKIDPKTGNVIPTGPPWPQKISAQEGSCNFYNSHQETELQAALRTGDIRH